MELPEYNIDPEAPVLQIVSLIAGWAKELEEKVVKIEEEYKAHIVELEAEARETPPKQCESRVVEL